jgi:Elongation factor P (EF-P) KOW-like domain/Elongation factor P (EF-P) OB domain
MRFWQLLSLFLSFSLSLNPDLFSSPSSSPNPIQQPSPQPEHLHVKPGKGAAFVRTKLKNYVTGGTMDKTFRGGEPVSTAEVFRTDTQYTYADGDDYVFMDSRTYEETRVKKDER